MGAPSFGPLVLGGFRVWLGFCSLFPLLRSKQLTVSGRKSEATISGVTFGVGFFEGNHLKVGSKGNRREYNFVLGPTHFDTYLFDSHSCIVDKISFANLGEVVEA